jgi:hypothetical protein
MSTKEKVLRQVAFALIMSILFTILIYALMVVTGA